MAPDSLRQHLSCKLRPRELSPCELSPCELSPCELSPCELSNDPEPLRWPRLTLAPKKTPDAPQRPLQRGRTYALPKGRCTSRSEWRVLPGKPFERLAPHYQLACEFGSSLMAAWRNDGIEPVYVCEEHAKELGHSAQPRASVTNPYAETGKNKNNETETSAEARPSAVSAAAHNAVSPSAIHAASPVVSATAQNAAAPTVTPDASPAASNNASKTADCASEPHRKATNSPHSIEERCAAIDQLISDLTARLETLFSKSEATISLLDTIDIPLERATLEIIANDALTEAQKDAAVQQLGTLQAHLKQGAAQDITALKAHQIKETMANHLSAENVLPDEAKPGYQAVHDSLKNAIHAAAPKAKHLEERLANLQKMKAELEDSPKAKELAPAVA